MEHQLHGTNDIHFSPSLVLHPMRSMQGTARMTTADDEIAFRGEASPDPGDPMPTLHAHGFSAAQPPVTLKLNPSPPPVAGMPSVPGLSDQPAQAQMATLAYTPDPGEAACYALVQAIHTNDGVIYDVALPQPELRDDEALPFDVIGRGMSNTGSMGTLHFPVHRLVTDTPPPSDPALPFDAVSRGGLGSATERVLHLVRAPIESNLHTLIRRQEVPLRIWNVAPDGTFVNPLDDIGAWRARFPEQREYRILLFLHGFTSRSERSLPRNWIQDFGSRYDAILAYDHPSILTSPLENARALIERIPSDLRLHADIFAHSRGGLVARSLVELETPTPRLTIKHVLMIGTPNAGTEIADYERWDRLLAMGFSTISWLTTIADAGVATAFTIQGLGLVLRASAQLLFDLPGLEAMSPTSDFLLRLNAPTDAYSTRYAAVTADFNPLTIPQPNFREALQSLAVQVFLQAPNDLVVRTDSMIRIDEPRSPLLGGRILQSGVHHHAYFDDPDVLAFARSFLSAA